ncbi:MAG: malto-oligosyltrehalose trehalohydrolase, partial [Planctomycetaceae bacterium]
MIDGQINFRVWAPDKSRVDLVIEQPEQAVIPMTGEAGFFSAAIADPGQRVLYRFRIDGRDDLLPDPASRFQPEGPDGPSQVIDPSLFAWTDQGWSGPHLEGQIIYEMHIGTFTPEGTWASAARQLPELVQAGVSLIEMMPVADFAGSHGWGYDGVNLFAPTRLYGRPDDLRSFINTAHELGIAVILDVVYNHLGPDGNFLRAFAEDYFTDRYECEWGDAVNFDGPGAQPVRDYFISNARYWIEEFHFDGFRIDATQQIFDASQPHIIAEITDSARRAAGNRNILIVAENEPQRADLLKSVKDGGAGLDALWNDDFHHTIHVALTGKKEAYCSDYFGLPQEIISTAKHGFLYQGQRSRWQNKPRGSPSMGIEHPRFICYIDNHDQVANSAWGSRTGQITSPGRHRAATALLLLGPWTPFVFQGQEFAASTPFLYFADHNHQTSGMVANGRKKFLSQFPSLAVPAMQEALAEPSQHETFLRSILDFRQRMENSRFYDMFKDLARLRRTDEVFSLQGEAGIDGAVLSDAAFVLRLFGRGTDRLLFVNLGMDLFFGPAPEPLLAPPREQHWRILFSTEEPCYGGSGTPDLELDQGWRIPAEAAIAFASEPGSPSVKPLQPYVQAVQE